MKRLIPALLVFFLISAACSLVSSSQTTPTVEPPTASPVPTMEPTSVPTAVSFIIQPNILDEGSAETGYTIHLEIPVLQPDEPAFNQTADTMIKDAAQSFKTDLQTVTPYPETPLSTMDVRYTVLLQTPNLISIQFTDSWFVSGAAHPGSTAITLNYDLANHRVLNLPDLFQTDQPYLQVISDECIRQLKARDIGADESGAAPVLENFTRWNLTPEGLVITFDPYQVAAYAAGLQQVTIPYEMLQSVLLPGGPASTFGQ
ncbi:MAG: DUF3298 domain-containing protein [Anaerolineaceae bacterium]